MQLNLLLYVNHIMINFAGHPPCHRAHPRPGAELSLSQNSSTAASEAPERHNISVSRRVFVSKVIQMFTCKFVMNKTKHNPFQINPTEASAPIRSLKSMSCISNTGSILLQSC